MSGLLGVLPSSLLFHPASLVLGALVLLVLGLYWYGYHGYALLGTLDIPGPKPHAFVGNIPDIKKAGGLHNFQMECLKKYGKVFTLCLGRRVAIAVADPEILKQVMVKEHPNFVNRFFITRPPSPFSKNVLSEKDERWKRIRNILTPTFSASKLKQMLNLMDEAADTLMKKIEEIADTGNILGQTQIKRPASFALYLFFDFKNWK